jgi:hypothetical protein
VTDQLLQRRRWRRNAGQDWPRETFDLMFGWQADIGYGDNTSQAFDSHASSFQHTYLHRKNAKRLLTSVWFSCMDEDY